MKRKVGIGPSGVISGGGAGPGGGGGGATGNKPAEKLTQAAKRRGLKATEGVCACPACGHESPRVIPEPCGERTCPECGAPMTDAAEIPA